MYGIHIFGVFLIGKTDGFLSPNAGTFSPIRSVGYYRSRVNALLGQSGDFSASRSSDVRFEFSFPGIGNQTIQHPRICRSWLSVKMGRRSRSLALARHSRSNSDLNIYRVGIAPTSPRIRSPIIRVEGRTGAVERGDIKQPLQKSFAGKCRLFSDVLTSAQRI